MATQFWAATNGRTLIGRVGHGSDLVGEIEHTCAEHGVAAAHVSAIGAVQRARYAYFEQDDHRYRELETDTHHEITGFIGNVSLREDKPFLHAHATFADAAGATVGGHLLPGIVVFACEVTITELVGVSLVRRPDDATGLWLW